MRRGFWKKYVGSAPSKHRTKRAGAKPKPTPSAAGRSSASILPKRGKPRSVFRGVRDCERLFVVLLALANDPETEIVAGVVWHVRIPSGGSQTGEARLPAAATQDSLRAGGRPVRIHFRYPTIRLKKVIAPFPNVPGHILDPKRARAEWKRADRRAFRIPVVDVAIAPGEDGVPVGEIREVATMFVVAPRIAPAIGAASGVFPFRFCRQAVFLPLPG